MPKELATTVAISILCLAVPMAGAMAQQSRYSQGPVVASSAYPARYAAPTAAAAPVGTWRSDAFYPAPLTLTITGMDRYGNLSGSLAGWRSSYTADGGEQTGNNWETWQRVFGRDARAFYRAGKLNISFNNGASYVLDYRGSELDGQFTADGENRPIVFLKSAAVAAR